MKIVKNILEEINQPIRGDRYIIHAAAFKKYIFCQSHKADGALSSRQLAWMNLVIMIFLGNSPTEKELN